MKKLIKTLSAIDGDIYVTSKGSRRLLASFTGRIEIYEKQILIPIFGKVEKGIKSIYASFIVADNVDYHIDIDENTIHSGKVYEATAFVENEKLYFAGLIFHDFDPISNELTFEIRDRELIEKLTK